MCLKHAPTTHHFPWQNSWKFTVHSIRQSCLSSSMICSLKTVKNVTKMQIITIDISINEKINLRYNKVIIYSVKRYCDLPLFNLCQVQKCFWSFKILVRKETWDKSLMWLQNDIENKAISDWCAITELVIMKWQIYSEEKHQLISDNCLHHCILI